MDLNKLPTLTALAVLKWCEKNKIDHSRLDSLLEILGKKRSSPDKQQHAPAADEVPSSKINYRKLRIDKGKTQEEVAAEVPMNIQTLSNIEKGKGKPRPATKAKLNTYYGVE